MWRSVNLRRRQTSSGPSGDLLLNQEKGLGVAWRRVFEMTKSILRNVVLAACVVVSACGQSGVSAPEPVDAPPAEAIANAAPANVGDCAETTVTLVGPRLEGAPDSGSGIVYANGLTQVEYDVVPGIAHSQVGDAVRLCLVSVPENCPPGDDRGRVYAGTNLRTNETWQAPDSQHICGGA